MTRPSSPGNISCLAGNLPNIGPMIQGTCTDLFHHDTTVILTESTASGNPTFQNWTGCDPVSPDGTTCLLVIRSANRTVDAFFN